jgi:hypothetical protein
MLHRVKQSAFLKRQEGKAGYILAWLVGIPLPILVLVYLLRGCN